MAPRSSFDVVMNIFLILILPSIAVGEPKTNYCVSKYPKSDQCCPTLYSNSSRNTKECTKDHIMACDDPVKSCKEIITDRISGLNDNGVYFLPESFYGVDMENRKDLRNLLFNMDLLSVGDLGHDGVLHVTVRVTVSWTNNDLRWDEDRPGCLSSTPACQLFLKRTKDFERFVTLASNTKVYNFKLVNDTTTDLLSKKMEAYPLIVERNGTVAWSGELHLDVRCALKSVNYYPFDAQICRLQWEMVPELRQGMRLQFEGDQKADNSDHWHVKSYKFVGGSQNGAFRLILLREPMTVMVTVLVPFLCFNALIGLVYVLPASSGERVGFSVTLVLSFSVLLMGISSMVPSDPNGPLTLGRSWLWLFLLLLLLLLL